MTKEIAKLVVVKPVLGYKKKSYLEKWGFTKTNGEWSKEGTVEELKNFWDEIDVYKRPIVKEKHNTKSYWDAPNGSRTSGMYSTTQRKYVHNDYDLDFYLQVEKMPAMEDAA